MAEAKFATNHLVIGLGGTGGKIIRAMRKLVHQMHNGRTPSTPAIDYFYVDSDAQLFRQDEPSWKVLGGHSVQLGTSNQLHISKNSMSLGDILANLGSYPGIRPWIGDVSRWSDLIGSKSAAEVRGGQRRRLGRFLFASEAENFAKMAGGLVRQMQNGGTIATTFHVCAGLAGGTGSGSVVDVVCQLRKNFPAKDFKIILYLLLPDAMPPSNWATGLNYWANGYAALLELNALSVGSYQPFDITPGGGKRLKLSDPFNCAYVFTNQNESGFQIDVDKALPEMVANFLYHKTYTLDKTNGEDWPLVRHEAFENRGDALVPEKSADLKRAERGRKFLTFGIKQIAYPEQEIRDFLTFAFARQAALQLMYSHWLDKKGFTDEPRNLAVSDYLQKPDVLNRWRISDDHLVLSLPILDDGQASAKWKQIEADWMQIMNTFKTDITERASKENWLDELTKLTDKRFREGFRSVGVSNYYSAQIRDRMDYAREITRTIEQDLLAQWRTRGQFASLTDISRLLQRLGENLEERDAQLKVKGEKLGKEVEVGQARIKQQETEWAKIGPLSEMVGKRKNIFDARALTLQGLYIARTRKEALVFAQALLKELVQEVAVLRANVDRTLSILTELGNRFVEEMDSRCRDNGELKLEELLVRFYDPKIIKDFCRKLETDEEIQKQQTDRLRSNLLELVGENPTFLKFTQIPKTRISEVMESSCKSSVEDAHNQVQAVMRKDPIFGASILDKIQEKYGDNPTKLRAFVTDLAEKAQVFLAFDAAEKNKVGVKGQIEGDGAAIAVRDFTVILPKANNDFAEQLKQEFKTAESKVELAPIEGRPHEIVLVALKSVFPLRFGAHIKLLKRKYDELIEQGGRDRVVLETHTEDWPDGGHPELYLPTSEEVGVQTLPLILIGMAIGAVQVEVLKKGKSTRRLIFIKKDPETGLEEESEELGEDAVQTLITLTTDQAVKISNEVKRILLEKKGEVDQIKNALSSTTKAEQDYIKEKYGGIGSAQNKQLMAGTKQALEILATL